MGNPVEEGQVLFGKYRVERVVGKGGMGVVVAARHISLDDRVAMKFLLPDAVKNAEVVARFTREARAAVRIKSEHVAKVIDVGTLEHGEPYMVMEFLEGQDLSDLVKDGRRLPIVDAVEYVLQASEALAEAHAAGIVHRDLKPANLFLTKRADGSPRVKVLDFGISKAALTGMTGPDMALTSTSAVMGSPLYMSPEQMRSSRNVDSRTDIWSIGVTLYELLTGATPFAGETITQLCGAVFQEPPISARSIVPEIPVGLEAILNRCMEKDPARRFPDFGKLAAALVPYGPPRASIYGERASLVLGKTSESTLPADRTNNTGVRAGSTGWDAATELHAPKKKGALALGLGLSATAVVAAAVIIGLFVTRGTPERPASATMSAAKQPAPVASEVTAAAVEAPPAPVLSPVVSGSASASATPSASAGQKAVVRKPSPGTKATAAGTPDPGY